MSEPLEDKVEKFAELARQRLYEEIARQKNQDTERVKWQGLDADGKGQVKFGNQRENVVDIGNITPKTGSSFIMDKQGSIELGERRKPQNIVGAKSLDPLNIDKNQKRDELLPPIEVILGDEDYNYLLIYRNAAPIYWHSSGGILEWSGYFWNYGKQDSFTSNDVLRESTNVNSTSFTVAETYISSGAPGYITQASASVNWGGSAISISDSYNYPGTGAPQTRFSHAIYSSTGTNNGSGTVSIAATDYAYARAGVQTHSFGLDISTTYYYTLGGDTEIERSIDIATIAGSNILYIWNVHNYLAVENEEHILYSVFVVRQVLSDDYSEDVITNNSSGFYSEGLAIPLTAKFVHTRLNFETGSLSSNVTQGSLIPGLGQDWAEWQFNYTATGFEMGALHFYVIDNTYSGYINVTTPINFNIAYNEPSRIFDVLDPTPIFSSAFSGDWISSISFQAWTTNYQYNWDLLVRFLMLNYDPQTQKLDSYSSRMAPAYPRSAPCNEITWPQTYESLNAVNISSIQNMADIATAIGGMSPVGDVSQELDVRDWFQYVALGNINDKAYPTGYFGANVAPDLTMNLPMANLGTSCSFGTTDSDVAAALLGDLRYIRIPK